MNKEKNCEVYEGHMEATLTDVLAFREAKEAYQNQMMIGEKDCVVISFSMNIPGTRKTSSAIYRAFLTGTRELELILKSAGIWITKKETIECAAGFASIFAISSCDIREIKDHAIRLEECHPLGRLFDVDVLNSANKSISRRNIGFSSRKCLLCNEDAKVCGRSHKHTIEELEQQVNQIIEDFETLV